MTLSPSQLAIFRTAAPSEVERGFARVEQYAAGGRWLSPANRYRTDVISVLAADGTANVDPRPRQLCDYIAASVPLHLTDGWGFLGAALGAHIDGEPAIALHLAYYAELRAAMSLLASQGVGIFNNRHFVIPGWNEASRVPRQQGRPSGTHTFTWDALDAWADSSEAGALLSGVLSPFGTPMADWVAGMGLGQPWGSLGADWLRSWGLDLSFFETDHTARNSSSYRPARLGGIEVFGVGRTAQFVGEIWRLLEPQPISAFEKIDRFLLRRTLERAFFATQGMSHIRASRQFAVAVERSVRENAAATEYGDELLAFLLRRVDAADPQVVRLAEGDAAALDSESHLGVISRALLLLRTASGACAEMLRNAGSDFNGFAFWWGALGQGIGLWDDVPDARRLMDLWDDVELDLVQLATWFSAPTTTPRKTLVDDSETCQSIQRLTRCQLVGLWAMAT